jgi:ubiquinone biosynthesis UbiH/UbiF/VisC/COQ6 family hydroxylase
LVDASSPPAAFDPESEIGLRVSAISPGSAAVLDQVGAWQTIEARRSSPYRRMVVEDRVATAAVEFEAAPFGLERLGTIVENDLVRRVLWDTLEGHALVELRPATRLERLEQDADHVRVHLSDGTELSARLLLGCDGAASIVRRAVGVSSDAWDYNQRGLVCSVRKSRPNPAVAWQRFLPTGPLAFLPLEDGRSSLVWTLPADEATRLEQASGEEFRSALDEASDGWLGSVEEVGPRASFPLRMRLAERFVSRRVVLLGDAAHVVHPLAGQGVNLGLADAAALVETLARARRETGRLAYPAALQRFQRWRRSESGVMAGGIHALGLLFRPDALSAPRRLGLELVSRSWLAREAFVHRAAGLGPDAPRLLRGETLQDLLR